MQKISGQTLLIELLGSFWLIFIGATAAIASQQTDHITHFGAALAVGLTITCLISGLSNQLHLNPVVTLAFYLSQRCSLATAIGRFISQILAAYLAALVLTRIFETKLSAAMFQVAPAIGQSNTFILEALFSFLMILTILRTTNSMVIGAVIFLGLFIGGSITGISLNPARSLSPLFMTQQWTVHWLYWLAPTVGSSLAVLIYRLITPIKSSYAHKTD